MKLSLKRKQNNDTPPWVKANSAGDLYVDTSDSRYQALSLASLEYLNQWSIVDGGLKKTKDKGLKKPNWRDFI